MVYADGLMWLFSILANITLVHFAIRLIQRFHKYLTEHEQLEIAHILQSIGLRNKSRADEHSRQGSDRQTAPLVKGVSRVPILRRLEVVR